jgi:hypothetical protein
MSLKAHVVSARRVPTEHLTTNGTSGRPTVAAKKPRTSPAAPATGGKSVVVAAPNFMRAEFLLVGTAPLVINKFSAKAQEMMRAKQEAGDQGGKRPKRDPKDFDLCYQEALRTSPQGWHGIHAGAFRNAIISACRLVGFKMTIAKLTVFVDADGRDQDDGAPLVKITKGKPSKFEMAVRNESGVADIRARPMWEPGWECVLRVSWDADQFSLQDITNLLMRVGIQVGICEGRPDSSKSNGMGWGLFSVESRS